MSHPRTANIPSTPSMKTNHLPNDARLIALLLASRGVEDADERVLHQLLDFAHRYTTELFKDANAFAQYDDRSGIYGPGPSTSSNSGPGKNGVSTGMGVATGTGDESKGLKVDDVEMAVRARSGWEFQEGAPKDYLLPLARQLNALPLPILPESHSHIRLPPRSQMLGTLNFEFVPRGRDGGAAGAGGEEEESDGSDSGTEAEGEDEDDDQARAGGSRAANGQSHTNGGPGGVPTGGKRKRSSDRMDDPGRDIGAAEEDAQMEMVGEDDIDVDREDDAPSRSNGAETEDQAGGNDAEDEEDDDEEDMEEVPPIATASASSSSAPIVQQPKRQVEEDDDYDAE